MNSVFWKSNTYHSSLAFIVALHTAHGLQTFPVSGSCSLAVLVGMKRSRNLRTPSTAIIAWCYRILIQTPLHHSAASPATSHTNVAYLFVVKTTPSVTSHQYYDCWSFCFNCIYCLFGFAFVRTIPNYQLRSSELQSVLLARYIGHIGCGRVVVLCELDKMLSFCFEHFQLI